MNGARAKLERRVAIKRELVARKKLRLVFDQYNGLYHWQRKFNAETKNHRSCMLMAANRVGKTRTGLTIDAFHLTGDYPSDWEGHVFEKAPMCWLLGFSGEKTRDLLQTPLFGRIQDGKFTGGLVPAERIVDYRSMSGTSGACREVRVKRKDGTISTCQFWSYSQGQHAIMGDSVDWFHIDEEPEDKEIYPQVITRTATGDNGKGGRGILTFTPENGRTELVKQFMDEKSPSRYLQKATWNDAKHLTEETKELLLAEYPTWQRDMRTKGEPLQGTGLIYDFPDTHVKCQPFECPEHWWVINGMDFGFDHPQAHLQLWWDKDTDTFYIAHAWRQSKALPDVAWAAVKAWAKGVPTAWPHDGLQHEKGSGKQQMDYYKDSGWVMTQEHATWQAGGNGVEAGLVELYMLMKRGKLKVFSHLSDWFEEKLHYHRDEKGKIVKTHDDLLDAMRYAYMMRRFAIQKCNIIKTAAKVHIPPMIKPRR